MKRKTSTTLQKVKNWLILNGHIKNQRELADRLNITPPTLSYYLSGRMAAPDEVIERVNERFPEISLTWLKTGKGKMILPMDEIVEIYASASKVVPAREQELLEMLEKERKTNDELRATIVRLSKQITSLTGKIDTLATALASLSSAMDKARER